MTGDTAWGPAGSAPGSARGLQAERTRLAWQRSALGAGVVALLLLYQAVHTGWSVLAAAAAGIALASLVLAVAGAWRSRRLRTIMPPRPVSAAVSGAVAGLVTATAVLTLISLPW